MLRTLVTAFILGLSSLSLLAQQAGIPVASNAGLPDAPGVAVAEGTPENAVSAPKSNAVISGTVIDANGSEVQGARVELSQRGESEVRVLQTGSNGEFNFAGLSAGTYRITVTGSGMGTFVSEEIKLYAGEFRIVSQVLLPMAATTTDVTVIGDKEELAQQQVHIAVQQRVLGVFPNFYSSYDWNAPPMGAKQKFHLAFRAVTDPVSFLGAGGVAGFEQFNNIFPGYGSGVEGYAKRFGAAYANDFSGRMLGGAVFPSLFRQDPRYFYRGSGSTRTRLLYAIAAAFITRGDNGHWQPNYSHILGNFAAGGISNIYYPSTSRGASLTLTNGLIETAGDAGTNILREFFLRGITSKVPATANGKP